MEKYSNISKLYLKYQKKRTILTICGVALAVGALFIILTLYFSNFINKRDALRKEENYEMVFIPENEEQLAAIVSDDNVKSAYKGQYYINSNAGYINNALFINTKNPYRINKIFKEITEKYNIEGEINNRLASYYLQGDGGDTTYIVFIMFLFLAVIFAIIGVGIIRNSIQLNTLEQIKDYGILRCVGATKQQLQSIIFLMGFRQELAGIILGMVLGFPIAVVIGVRAGIKVGLHIVPVIFVLVAFLGDLYFVMKENSRVVKKISPVEAVRGNLKVRKTKIKARKRGIFGHIFGMEGEYAYKSLMANKGRFYKSVATFALGIAAFIILSVVSYSISDMKNDMLEMYGEYQLYYSGTASVKEDIDTTKSRLPEYDTLLQISKDECVKSVKPVYNAAIPVVDLDTYYSRYDKDYMEKTLIGDTLTRMKSSEISRKLYFGEVTLYGYDDEELKAYEDLLLEGTLDVSDKGIIITKQVMAMVESEEYEDTLVAKMYTYNDYELGDTIELVNFQEMKKLYLKRLNERRRYDEKNYNGKNSEKERELYLECWQEMIAEGKYETYTVEGIVQYEKDKMHSGITTAVILPLDKYCKMTGLGEAESTGVKLKIGEKISKTFLNLYWGSLATDEDGWYSEYIEMQYALAEMKKINGYILMFILFITAMSSVNIINTSAGNLHLRRKELAQLRALGISKKRLSYMVLLEGIITAITANFIGDVLGFVFMKPLASSYFYIFKLELKYPIAAAVIGFVVSTVIFCGSLFVQIRRLGNDVLENLNAGGD